MAKTRQQKEITVSDLTDKLRRMKALVFTSFAGLTVKEVTELRGKLRELQIDHLVAKKSLLRRSLKDAGLDIGIADQLQGGSAMTFGYEDEITAAKVLQTYGKEHKALTLVGGIVNGGWYSAKQMETLAKLPGRQELLTQTVWTLKAPLTGLASVLVGNLRGLLTVLNARREKLPA